MTLVEELEIVLGKGALIERSRDYPRAVEKTNKFVVMLFFYVTIFLFGIFAFGFGCFMAFTGNPWWGHTVAEILLGAIMVLVSVPAFINDTAYCFDRRTYED